MQKIVHTDFHKALVELSTAIKTVRSISPKVIFQSNQSQFRIDNGRSVVVQTREGNKPPKVIYDAKDYFKYNEIYERLSDINKLSLYLLKCIEYGNNERPYPELFIDSVSERKPTENEILKWVEDLE